MTSRPVKWTSSRTPAADKAVSGPPRIRHDRADIEMDKMNTTHSDNAPTWHTLAPEAVARRFAADVATGLSEAEADRRLQEHGPNRLAEKPPRSPWRLLLDQFKGVLILVLIGAAVLAGTIRDTKDAVVILIVVVINALLGFYQEYRAERSLAALKKMLAPEAEVRRDGRTRMMSAEQVVPGDIVVLDAGDRVPTDGRIIVAHGVEVDESSLTGESHTVGKRSEALNNKGAPLAERENMLYMNTTVTRGRAEIVVTATGMDTEMGRLAGMLAEAEEAPTPLQIQLDGLGKRLAAIAGVVVIVMLTGEVLRGEPWIDMVMNAIALAVAAIPEGLPAVVTVTLALGLHRMAKHRAIVKRLAAVETLGCTTVICSDKTGTLTRNEMTVQSIVLADGRYAVEGAGYVPHGGFQHVGQPIQADETPMLMQAVRAALLCNDATLEQKDDDWIVHGDPMEGALVAAAAKAGLEPEEERRLYPRTDLIPFESEHKFMATLHHAHDGTAVIYLKGAPEQVLARCSMLRVGDGAQPLEIAQWRRQVEEQANQGQRVLAVACKPVQRRQQELDFDDVADGLELLGLFGLIDPPRDEAITAVAECRTAGVRVKMITGDHAGTARAIAAQLKLENSAQAITGHDLDQMDDTALSERVREVDVYARVSPEHKLRLVTQLQAQGAIVAMTGDGVNDAPALKRADVGIAMGHKGSEAAKEASEMVIVDDNFASIAHAVEQGRTVYDNLKKAIVFLLPINGGEAMSIMIAVLFGFTLPITPVQILWVNMVSSVALAMALAFEATEPETMRRPPRPATEAMLSGFLLWRIALVSALMAGGVFGIFGWASTHGSTLEEARTYAVNTLVAMEVFYLFSVRYLRTPSFKLTRLFNSRAALVAVVVVVVLQLFFTYAPFMERFFDTRSVDFVHGVEIIGLGLALFMILELEKLVLRQWRRNQGAQSGAES